MRFNSNIREVQTFSNYIFSMLSLHNFKIWRCIWINFRNRVPFERSILHCRNERKKTKKREKHEPTHSKLEDVNLECSFDKPLRFQSISLQYYAVHIRKRHPKWFAYCSSQGACASLFCAFFGWIFVCFCMRLSHKLRLLSGLCVCFGRALDDPYQAVEIFRLHIKSDERYKKRCIRYSNHNLCLSHEWHVIGGTQFRCAISIRLYTILLRWSTQKYTSQIESHRITSKWMA